MTVSRVLYGSSVMKYWLEFSSISTVICYVAGKRTPIFDTKCFFLVNENIRLKSLDTPTSWGHRLSLDSEEKKEDT